LKKMKTQNNNTKQILKSTAASSLDISLLFFTESLLSGPANADPIAIKNANAIAAVDFNICFVLLF
ncbi:MAG: hypothetical protein AAFQ94_26220, partial [Bacteroidota bacterium]